ncbi:hypothetical protein MTO96_010825 [Rhipicephalus appendiculatus]
MAKKGRNHRKKARRRTELVSCTEDNSMKLGEGWQRNRDCLLATHFLRVPTCLLITTETALSSSLRDFVVRNHRQLSPT